MGAVQVGINNDNNGAFLLQIYLCKINFYPGETLLGEIKLFLKTNLLNSPQLIKSPTVSYTLIHREYWQNHDNVPSNSYINTSQNIKTGTSFPNTDEGAVLDDNNHLKEEIIFSKKEIYNNLINNNIQNGISIPFQIMIPKNAKPSLEFLNTAKIYAYSRTYLNIELPEYGNNAKLLLFIQKYPTPLKSELTIIKSVTKKKLGFLGSGNNVNFQGSYPKNAYGFNEVCPLNIKLDTYGAKEPIKSISIILKRKVSFLENGIKSLFKMNEYNDDLWQNAMLSFESAQDFNFNIPLIESQKIFMQKKTLFFDLNSINKQNLICLLPSYEGNFIKCEYFIQVKVMFDSLLIKDPEFIMPLDVGHSPSLFLQNFIFDINKIINNYNCSLSMAFLIPNILKNNDINNNSKNNYNQDDYKKVFGREQNNIINNKDQIRQNIFGNINNSNMNNMNNINNINNINSYNKEGTPEGINNQQNNNIQINPYQNINLENSNNLPSLEELNNAKNEKPAPGLTPDA